MAALNITVKDRVKETTTTTGTGTLTLAGAVAGFNSFSVVGDGNSTYYSIVEESGTDWEVGIGTYTATGTTLSRDTVLESSNAGSLVNFGAGSKEVFVTYPAEQSVFTDPANLFAVDLLGGAYPTTNTLNTRYLTAAGMVSALNGSSVGHQFATGQRVDTTLNGGLFLGAQCISGALGQNQTFLAVMGGTSNAFNTNVSLRIGDSSTDGIVLDDDSYISFRGQVIAVDSTYTSTKDTKVWSFEGAAKAVGSGAANRFLVGTPVINTIAQEGITSGWSLSIYIDTSGFIPSGYLTIDCITVAATGIKFSGYIQVTQLLA